MQSTQTASKKSVGKKRAACMLLALLLLFWSVPVRTQTPQKGRKQFYELIELTKLIEKAKEAGFSDEEIENLQIRDGEQVINVTDYIGRIKGKKIFEQEKLDDFKKKKFLTVRDIFVELVKLEPNVLTRLREELASER